MAIDYKPEQNEYKNMTPFKTWLMYQINTWGVNNFPFLENDFDQLTNYGMMMKLMKALNDNITNQNLVEEDMTKLYEAFTELQTYIDNYFDNLDVQEEIDNKLDEMAESGELADIIAQYLEVASVLAFDTKASLKSADNLVNGSITRTLGESTYNDGKGSYYKIRTITSGDVVDDNNILALVNYPTLIAEKINNNYLTFETIENTTEINSKFKNINLNIDYYNNSIIYLIRLKDINNVELALTSENIATPFSNTKNVYDFVKNKTFDLVINATLEGKSIINGEVIDSPITGIYYGGFDNNNNLKTTPASVISTATDLLNQGYKNAGNIFAPIITNGQAFDYSSYKSDPVYENKHPRQVIMQSFDGTLYLMTVLGRTIGSSGLTYNEMYNYIISKNLNIETAINLDGGGSIQNFINNKPFFISQDVKESIGRKIPTVYCFNIKEVN